MLLISASHHFVIEFADILQAVVTRNREILVCFTVLGLDDDTGWGCVSENGEKSYEHCESASETRNWTTLSDAERCE